MSSDTKDSTGSTGIAPTPVPPTPSAGTTVNPPADPSFAPPVGHWFLTETGSCVWSLKTPKRYISCPGESFGNTDPATVIKSAPTVKPLSYGEKQSVDVVNLQVALKSAGFLNAAPNGSFGPATRTAVMAVQKAKGLPVNGIADKKTIDAINGKEGGAQVTPPSLSTRNNSSVDVDTFIKNIPKQISILQLVLQNPDKYKEEAKSLVLSINAGSSLKAGEQERNHICVNNNYGGSNEYYWINGSWMWWALWSEPGCMGTSNSY
jgi:hypothetical protein